MINVLFAHQEKCALILLTYLSYVKMALGLAQLLVVQCAFHAQEAQLARME
jgi:hypothetical protein